MLDVLKKMKKVNKIIKIPKLLSSEVVNVASQHEEGDFEFKTLGRDRMNIFGQ